MGGRGVETEPTERNVRSIDHFRIPRDCDRGPCLVIFVFHDKRSALASFPPSQSSRVGSSVAE